MRTEKAIRRKYSAVKSYAEKHYKNDHCYRAVLLALDWVLEGSSMIMYKNRFVKTVLR